MLLALLNWAIIPLMGALALRYWKEGRRGGDAFAIVNSLINGAGFAASIAIAALYHTVNKGVFIFGACELVSMIGWGAFSLFRKEA